MNKDNVLLTPDVIEECLSESFDIYEKHSQLHEKSSKIIKMAS